MKRIIVFLIWGLQVLAGYGFAQSVRVMPDRTQVTIGETLNLVITMEGEFDDITGPDLGDFDVVGKSSGTSVSIIGGSIRKEQRITLTLLPKHAGNLTIGAVNLYANGKVVASSKPLVIKVISKDKTMPLPKSSEEQEVVVPQDVPTKIPDRYAEQSGFLIVHAPDRQLYVGEPVYIEYVLYTRSDIPITNIKIENLPKLKGFVVEQPQQGEGQERRIRIGGVLYDARVQWRGAITAIDGGQIPLDQITVIVSVGDFFTSRRYRITSEPKTLTFLPVPVKDRPADYVDGTIGKFAIKAGLDKQTIRVGEASVLTIEVIGAGNFKAIKPPSLPPMEGLNITRLPSSDLDDLRIDVGGISGKRVFQFMLRPDKPQDYDIGSISLSYFDPIKGKYERAKSERLQLSVLPSGSGPIHTVRQGESIIGIVTTPSLHMKDDSQKDDSEGGLGIIFGSIIPQKRKITEIEDFSKLLAIGIGIPFMGFLAVEAYVRRRKYLEANSGLISQKKALREVREKLRKMSREGEDIWNECEKIIRTYISKRFGFSTQSLTGKEIGDALVARGVRKDLVERLMAELENCAFAKFAPNTLTNQDKRDAPVRIEKLISDIDKCKVG